MQWLSYQGSTLVDERKKKVYFNVTCFCRDMLGKSGEICWVQVRSDTRRKQLWLLEFFQNTRID